MQCPIQHGDNAQVLLDYCARRLEPETAIPLERHLAQCPACRQFADAQQQVWAALDAWDAEPVSADFDSRLYAAAELRQEHAMKWRLRRLFGDSFTWKPALPFAAACITAALAFFLNVPSPDAGKAPERSHNEPFEVEQVEQTLEDVEMLRQFMTPGTQTL